MSDKESRAMGAGRKITVGEKEYMLRPVVVQQLCDLEQEALQFFRRQVLQTYRGNADLLGEQADELIAKKFEEVSRWSLDDLPKKTAYDASKLPVTDAARAWAKEFHQEIDGDQDEELDDVRVRTLIVVALDQERITAKYVQKIVGRKPVLAKVRYDQWWITGCFEGMVSFIFSSLRQEQPELTRKDVGKWPIAAIFEISRKVESITAPNLGNG